MIRVTVELVSAIDASRNRVLSKAGQAVSQVWRKGRVEGFPRKNRGGWDLLFLALRACVGDRNR